MELDYQRIQALIEERAREFFDTAPLKSSTSRAWNLFQQSGVSIDAFTDKVYQARALTQEATARITKTVEDPEYRVRRKSKMAYFFATLKDQLGLKEDAGPASPGQAPDDTSKRSAKGTAPREAAAPRVRQESTTPDLSMIWRAVLDDVSSSMTRATFARWLARTQLAEIAGDVATVTTPDAVVADWLIDRLGGPLAEALARQAGRSLQLSFEPTDQGS